MSLFRREIAILCGIKMNVLGPYHQIPQLIDEGRISIVWIHGR